MIPVHLHRALLWVGAAHLVVAVVCLFALLGSAAPINGVHPALKPMKFGFSIAIFLATMAIVVPALSIGPTLRSGIAWILSGTMIVEMMLIVVQALRATPSHFNRVGAFNTWTWNTMAIAITIATVTMACVAVIAAIRPLRDASGGAMHPLTATAWRAALWFFLLAAWSGFRMAGQSQHSVAGADGGPGLPLVNWSVSHGDLRVSHFIALHSLQTIPIIGFILRSLPIGNGARWTALIVAIVMHVAIVVWTLLQALSGRPFRLW